MQIQIAQQQHHHHQHSHQHPHQHQHHSHALGVGEQPPLPPPPPPLPHMMPPPMPMMLSAMAGDATSKSQKPKKPHGSAGPSSQDTATRKQHQPLSAISIQDLNSVQVSCIPDRMASEILAGITRLLHILNLQNKFKAD